MSLPQIRDEWRVPARPGQRVSIRQPLIDDDGSLIPITGTITEADEGLLMITPDPGCAYPYAFRSHPANLTYPTTTTEEN